MKKFLLMAHSFPVNDTQGQGKVQGRGCTRSKNGFYVNHNDELRLDKLRRFTMVENRIKTDKIAI